MNFCWLILTGTSGSGKTTVASALSAASNKFKHARAVTTRTQREGDTGEYDYVSPEKFGQLLDAGKLVVHADYRGLRYGILHDEVDRILRRESACHYVLSLHSRRPTRAQARRTVAAVTQREGRGRAIFRAPSGGPGCRVAAWPGSRLW
jgi:guanylate kinase